MITHLVKSINWIDVGLLVLLVWIVYVGVKTGFIAEFFKSLGIILAVFISLHYYSGLAAWIAQKTHFSWGYWDLVIFADLWCAIVFFFKFVKDGFFLLFKLETTHEGFDKYAAGVVAVGRGILICSMSLFLVLLAHNNALSRMAVRSYSFKIAGHAAVSTYSFLFNNVVSKFSPGEHFNKAAVAVLHPEK